MIIDMHSHWATKRGYALRSPEALAQQKSTWNSEPAYMTESEMADHFRERGVAPILDLGFTKDLELAPLMELHDYAFDFQREHADIVIGHWLNIDPQLGDAAVRELERCLEADCFVGLSISGASNRCPATDEVWKPLVDTCEARGCPVLVMVGHNGSGAGLPGGAGMILDHCHPRYIDALAATHPNLRILAGRPAWPWQDEMISVMLHKPNVWNELHGWSPRYLTPSLQHEISRRLRSRIMFGADFPLLTYERLESDWLSLGFDDAVLNGVLRDNSARFLSGGRPFEAQARIAEWLGEPVPARLLETRVDEPS